MYTSGQAKAAFRNAHKATYQNVWTFLYGENNCTRDEAKIKVYAYAKEKGVRAGELFDMYNEALNASMFDLSLEGYFDF